MSRIGSDVLGPLYDEHSPALLLYARQYCDTPEDVVQDAFIALAGRRELPDRVLPWLLRVVRNGALAAARSSRRRTRREAAVATADATAWFAAADDRIDARRAQELLGELEPEIRAVVVARTWAGLTFDEIARAHGCSVTTAHRRYQAGLARLHERLGGS